MVTSLFRTVTVFLCVVVFISMVGGAATSAPVSPAGWSRHDDPAGFSVSVPEGWKVATDQQSGRITFSGGQGERLTVWPLLVRGRQLGRSAAGTIVQQLARKVNAGLSWQKPEYSGNTVRVVARSAKQTSVILLSWTPSPEETAFIAFVIEAPPAIYPASVETFRGILGTLRTRAGSDGTARQGSSPGPLSFVRWTDPIENAFSLSVPKGWTVTGGLYRVGVNDTRTVVRIQPSDQGTWVFFGDPSYGGFTELSPVLARSRLREGQYTALHDGSRLLIRKYCPGRQFALEYANGTIRRQCGDLRVTASSDRPDLASTLRKQSLEEGRGKVVNPLVTAGEVSFTCAPQGSGNAGTRLMGRVIVATWIPFPQQYPAWYLLKVYGYVAPAERQAEADSVCRQVAASYTVDPQWRAQQANASAQALQQGIAASNAIKQRSDYIANSQQAINDSIMHVATHQWTTAKMAHDIDNTILGRQDVVDERTGQVYNVDVVPNGNHTWMDPLGNIRATSTDQAPGPEWTKLKNVD